MKDKIGFEIPEHLEETWQEAERIGRELCRDIQRIYLMLEKKLAEHDPIFCEVNQQTVCELKNAYRTLALIIPYAICPYDLGDPVKRDKCPACYSTGYLPKFRWDRCVPKSKKIEHGALIAGHEFALT